MSQRKKTGGRKAGTENKLSGLAKDNIAAVFNRLGGTAGMAEWAIENRTQFYQIYSKLLPLQVNADVAGELINKVVIEFVDAAK
jgi:UV DNA damage repair endonuclease